MVQKMLSCSCLGAHGKLWPSMKETVYAGVHWRNRFRMKWSHKKSTSVCLAKKIGKSFFQNVSNTQERQQEPSSWPLASFSKAVKKLSLTRQAKFHPTCSPLLAILRQHKGTWNCRMLRQSAGKGMRFCGTGSTSYCQPHNVRDKWDLNNWIDCLGLIGWFRKTCPNVKVVS